MVLALATLVLLGQLSSADEIQGPLPTLLEEYANRPGANLIFSRETGRLSSDQTQVTITAIVIELMEQHLTRMQGIQVDLVGRDGTDRVYLDADGISAVLRDIGHLQRTAPNFPLVEGIRGTARCAPGADVHTLCPEYFRLAESSGIALRAAKAQWFPLPGLELQELTDAIDRAIAALESAESR